MSVFKRSSVTGPAIDKLLGLVGGGLAGSSLAFGVYMNIHGPAAGFGQSHDFTVFAQLAGHGGPDRRGLPVQTSPTEGSSAYDMVTTGAVAAKDRQVLDMTATGSISPSSRANDVLSAVTIEAASDGGAMIVIDGHVKSIHVGDELPELGEILAIVPGPHPLIRTSKGVISRMDGG
jgi:hypothetical protein